jgi:dTDP-4-amino-4,6-dideoxygalactose transaminase
MSQIALNKLYTSNPRANYLKYRQEIDNAIFDVLEAGNYILGPNVEQFEKQFSNYCKVDFGVGVANGTDAICLALLGIGIMPQDEVITVSFTAAATVFGIEMAKAIPVLVDVDPLSNTIDSVEVEKMIGPKTKAIVPVHLYGHPCDVVTLKELCNKHGLFMVEDCAQAHGAEVNDLKVGNFGDAAAFSFYPTKNLGAIGDGGMVITSNYGIAERLKMLRQYGWKQPQFSEHVGLNSRLDELQAAVLMVKLRYLEIQTERRRELAHRYIQAFTNLNLPLQLPYEKNNCKHVYHLFVIEVATQNIRDRLKNYLQENGIMAGIHYAFAVHEQPYFKGRFKSGSLKRSEKLARTVLSLPLYPEISDKEQIRIIETIQDFFKIND